MRYFHLRGRNSRKSSVISVPPKFDELAFWNDLENRSSDSSWLPPTACVQDGELVDWAPSNLFPRLCSTKLKRLLDGCSNGLVWLPVNVESSQGQVTYFILHFSEFGEVIDPEKSTFVAGRLFKPHLAASKVGQRSIFAIQPLSSAVIVNEEIKLAITESHCSGIEFEHCPCS